MPPTCAACRQPIWKPQKILLVDTEVIHKACAGMRTIGQERAQQIADASHKIAHEIRLRELALVSRSVAEQRAAELEQSSATALAAHAASERRATKAAADLTAARQELATLKAEVDRLRSPQQQPAATKQPEDDTAVRFSLLELDSS